MQTLEFSPGLHLGIELIDDQHGQFFAIMNRLIAAEVGQDQGELVADILRELTAYVSDHFATEEELMARFDYPGLAAHRTLHTEFADRVEEFQRKYEAAEIGLEDEMLGYLVEWFTEHVRQEDPKYTALFRAHGL